MHRCIPLLLALATLRLATAGETPTPPKAEAPSVFDTPLLVARQMAVSLQFIQLARAKRFAEAEALLVKAVAIPNFDTAVNHYNLACLHALQGKGDAALADLAAAVERGYTDAKHMREDADLKSLHALPRFEAIAKDAEAKTAATPRRRPVLKRVKDGVATVDEANVFWSARAKQFIVLHSFPDAEPATPITTMKGPAGDLLREWKKDGAAAGLHGVLYDNRDRGHSTMNTRQFPQIARVEYCEAARKRGFDNGLQRMFLHNAPTLGNSSTALTRGAAWGSQTRSALRRTQLIDVLARQYVNNHLYFYPEHRDHDVDSHGDVFHMNVPYVITSQGSSGSDRAFMDAAACILAAFRPDTRSALAEKKLLMPTVQMVFRMNRTVIANPSDYLTGKAHPMAFDAKT
ncbi:hypothetical protein HQ560_02065, partial [bacterium]|nr:hypothetical protein [bacterium]